MYINFLQLNFKCMVAQTRTFKDLNFEANYADVTRYMYASFHLGIVRFRLMPPA